MSVQQSKFIIDDSTPFETHTSGDQALMCGTLPRRVVYGAVPGTQPSTVNNIPMEEWPDRIADLERNKANLKYVWQDSPIGVLMQGQLQYCHAFSLNMAVMLERELMGLPYVETSASSVGAVVTGFQNKGWYIEDDLAQAVNCGVCDTSFVPMCTTNGRDFKIGWKANAAKHRVTVFGELKPRDFKAHGSALLCLKPCPIAVNYWGHSTCDLVLRDLYPNLKATDENRYGVESLNSWDKSWGDGGWYIRAGSKKYADSIYHIEQMVNVD